MSILSHPLTYADLERAREDSEARLELIGGELFLTPSPTAWHQVVALRLSSILQHAVMDTALGVVLPAPFDVSFEDQTVLQPDLLVLLNDRSPFLRRTMVAGAPTLVIEITSPSTVSRDRELKRTVYARHRVPEYWIVDADARTATTFSDPRHGAYQRIEIAERILVSTSVPGLTVDLARLFAPLWSE